MNRSPLGGQERVVVYTVLLAEGTLFYYLTIVPADEASAFAEAFQRITTSLRLGDAC